MTEPAIPHSRTGDPSGNAIDHVLVSEGSRNMAANQVFDSALKRDEALGKLRSDREALGVHIQNIQNNLSRLNARYTRKQLPQDEFDIIQKEKLRLMEDQSAAVGAAKALNEKIRAISSLNYTGFNFQKIEEKIDGLAQRFDKLISLLERKF